MKIKFRVDEKDITVEAEPTRRLLDILREDLGITSIKEGCGEGECGACSVLLNGRLVNSCIVPAGQLEGAEVITPSGLSQTKRGKVIEVAFAETHASQCGFCSPGMYMAAEALLAKNPKPNEEEIREAISGNLCRCTGYDMIIDGIKEASDKGDGLW